MLSKWAGPALVALASLLWATDALIRMPAVEKLDPTLIVFAEHVVGVAILLPWIAWKIGKPALRLGPRGWFSALVTGAGGSAIATVLFTASFRYVNPSVAILLQKLQPVFVVLLAKLFLKERPERSFYLWGAIALGAAAILSFPDLDLGFLSRGLDMRSRGTLYAMLAAGIWAVSTVAGKTLVNRAPATLATFWRFTFGLATLGFLLVLATPQGPVPELKALAASDAATVRSLVYIGLVPGLAAMLAYYAGMRRTPASVVTFVELLFPVAAVALNTLVLGLPLSAVQLASGAVLLAAVSRIPARMS